MITNHQQELVPIGQLKTADYNPRVMPSEELEKLKRSLREFGFVEPIVARREDGLVIGGHQRLSAMQELLTSAGQDFTSAMVPVVWLDGVSDDRAKLLNLALNKIHGDWDFKKLNDMLAGLVSIGQEIELSGFNAPEIADILSLMGSPTMDVASSIDVDAELKKEARRFYFEVATDEEAELCNRVLATNGMTGPGNAGSAFVASMRLADGNNQAS